MDDKELVEKVARALASRRNAMFPDAEIVASWENYVDDAQAAISAMMPEVEKLEEAAHWAVD